MLCARPAAMLWVLFIVSVRHLQARGLTRNLRYSRSEARLGSLGMGSTVNPLPLNPSDLLQLFRSPNIRLNRDSALL